MRAGWKHLSLVDVCSKITDGSHNPPKGIEASEYLMLSSKNVFDDCITLDKPRFLKPEDFERENRRTDVSSGDVLLTIVGTVGRAAVVPPDFPKITLQRSVGVLKPIPGIALSRYLMFALQNMLDELVGGARGVAQKGIYLKSLRDLSIPLPPLEEQQRIVAVLDEAFNGLARARAHAEANLQNARELFENFASGLFDEISAAPKSATLLVNELALAEKGSIRTGPFGSQLRHSEFVDRGIAVLGIDNAVNNEFRWGKKRFITEEKYDTLRRYTVRPGDVIITIMGTCGRCAVIPDDIPVAINTKHLCCITLDQSKCLPEYLHAYFLQSPKARTYLTAQASGSVMDGLNMGIIKELPVDLPSLERQSEIVGQLHGLRDRASAVAASTEAKISDLDDLRQSLLQKAFSGELT